MYRLELAWQRGLSPQDYPLLERIPFLNAHNGREEVRDLGQNYCAVSFTGLSSIQESPFNGRVLKNLLDRVSGKRLLA
jgi:hypothetical protein